MSRYTIEPCTLSQANEIVESFHRHHKRAQGHRFSILARDNNDNEIAGIAIVGRPVARMCDKDFTAEVTRLCVHDGRPNACSFLYASAARICKEMGFRKIQTYILDEEPGTSLKASGWVKEAESPGGQWKHTDGKERRTDQPTGKKSRWAKILAKEKNLLEAKSD